MMPSSAGNHKTQNPQINLPNTSIEIQSTPSSSQNNTKISAVHRKSQSLDASTIAAQLNRTPKNKSHSHIRERFDNINKIKIKSSNWIINLIYSLQISLYCTISSK